MVHDSIGSPADEFV